MVSPAETPESETPLMLSSVEVLFTVSNATTSIVPETIGLLIPHAD